MNKVVDDLLENVKEFEKFFNEYEKEFYLKVVKVRNQLLISLAVFIILIVISYVLWVGNFGNLLIKIVSLIFTAIALGCFIYLSRKFDDFSDGKPNKFEELCREVKANLIHKYGEKASVTIKLLIDDLTDKQNNRIKRYENLVQSVSAIGMILVTAFVTLILNKFFGSKENSISFNIFIELIVVVFGVVILMKAVDGFTKNVIEYPIFGKASKEMYLTDILYRVKYMVLEKENNND